MPLRVLSWEFWECIALGLKLWVWGFSMAVLECRPVSWNSCCSDWLAPASPLHNCESTVQRPVLVSRSPKELNGGNASACRCRHSDARPCCSMHGGTARTLAVLDSDLAWVQGLRVYGIRALEVLVTDCLPFQCQESHPNIWAPLRRKA